MKLVVVVSSGERLEMHSGVWQRVLLENTEFLSQSSVDIVVPHISSDSGISADAQTPSVLHLGIVSTSSDSQSTYSMRAMRESSRAIATIANM
jgi:hypothetical protein